MNPDGDSASGAANKGVGVHEHGSNKGVGVHEHGSCEAAPSGDAGDAGEDDPMPDGSREADDAAFALALSMLDDVEADGATAEVMRHAPHDPHCPRPAPPPPAAAAAVGGGVGDGNSAAVDDSTSWDCTTSKRNRKKKKKMMMMMSEEATSLDRRKARVSRHDARDGIDTRDGGDGDGETHHDGTQGGAEGGAEGVAAPKEAPPIVGDATASSPCSMPSTPTPPRAPASTRASSALRSPPLRSAPLAGGRGRGLSPLAASFVPPGGGEHAGGETVGETSNARFPPEVVVVVLAAAAAASEGENGEVEPLVAGGLPPRGEIAEPQRALLSALTQPSKKLATTAAGAARREGVVCCDKCDGAHATGCCPHFRGQSRDDHKDAWARYGTTWAAAGGAADGGGDGTEVVVHGARRPLTVTLRCVKAPNPS